VTLQGETPAVLTSVLELQHVTAGDGHVIVLRDVSVRVQAGNVVALVGPNGASKTTLLRVAGGLVSPLAGDVLVDGRKVTGSATDERARAGICLVPERHGIFPNLSVQGNLRLAVPSWSSIGASTLRLTRSRNCRGDFGNAPGRCPAVSSRCSP
jgi:ABC-type branched-subunit amino acid transport system ATPase component